MSVLTMQSQKQPVPMKTMKAIRMHKRGGPDLLVYEDAAMPVLGKSEMLIRVHAAAITPTELTWDDTYKNCEGRDRIPTIPGHDVSGVVEAVSPGVTNMEVGQDVYALAAFCRNGTAAEYVAVSAADVAPKPPAIDHIAAAAVPLSALTAWQALFDHARLKSRQRLLIHGAAGGVGTFAVQMAKLIDAHVIGTASPNNHTFLRNLGADEVINYNAVRFEDVVNDVDVVLDTVGGDTLARSWGVLRRGGALVTIAGSTSPEEEIDWGVRGISFVVQPNSIPCPLLSFDPTTGFR